MSTWEVYFVALLFCFFFFKFQKMSHHLSFLQFVTYNNNNHKNFSKLISHYIKKKFRYTSRNIKRNDYRYLFKFSFFNFFFILFSLLDTFSIYSNYFNFSFLFCFVFQWYVWHHKQTSYLHNPLLFVSLSRPLSHTCPPATHTTQNELDCNTNPTTGMS